MASQLKQAIKDLREQILSTQVFQYCAMFNNQVKMLDNGATFEFPRPAVLIEIETPMSGVQLLGTRLVVNDIVWKFSIVHEQLNAIYEDGISGSGMDENLDVYDLRDTLKTLLMGFKPTNCSYLQYSDESQDYNHNQIYVYSVSFMCSYVDTKGMVEYTTIEPPFALDLQGYINTEPTPATHMAYGWKACLIKILIVDTPNPSNTQTLGNGDVIPIEYVLNDDLSVTIPELISYPGIVLLTPSVVDNNIVTPITCEIDTNGNIVNGKLYAPQIGGLGVGNYIEINATLPIYTAN